VLNQYRINQVYLALGPTDLRKSIDGLALIVQESFKLDPFSRNLFVFCNRKKDKIKILEWDHNGFWLHYKRLEKKIHLGGPMDPAVILPLMKENSGGS